MVSPVSTTSLLCTTVVMVLVCCSSLKSAVADFTYPAEDGPHEATWLQWPHDYGWDRRHVKRYEESWIQLTEALHTGERVRIIVYDEFERRRVRNLLRDRGLTMSQIDIFEYPTDDVWIRDNGPMIVFNEKEEAVVEDWGFNGWVSQIASQRFGIETLWKLVRTGMRACRKLTGLFFVITFVIRMKGRKADWWYDDYIPIDVSYELDLPLETVDMVNEGGSVEVDGRGTLMAKRSSILNKNRNRGMTQQEAEDYFTKYLGVSNFIWLDGEKGIDLTDDHIDGTARFANGRTIVTHHRDDFLNEAEYDILKAAKDINGDPYELVELPMTKNKVPRVRDYGLYINYYVGNEVVIVPEYDDPNDKVAAEILQKVYPGREMVLINFIQLFRDGGVVHCVTKEEPVQNR